MLFFPVSIYDKDAVDIIESLENNGFHYFGADDGHLFYVKGGD